MPLSKIWKVKAPSPVEQQRLAEALGISPVTAQILIHRGVASPEAALMFLNPSLKTLPNPFLLPEMDKAVARLIQALREKENIAIYGDYDVDGLSSAALLTHFLRALNVEPILYIPDRMEEGYGVHSKALESLHARGAKLVVTVDCGTKSHEALARAKALGLDVLVTDHHECDTAPPPCAAFVNPQTGGPNNIGKELAGVGVVFFLLMGLRQKMREEHFFGLHGATGGASVEPNLKQHLDLVALATIADMAPLTGINRTLVLFGLKELAETKKAGLIALKEIARIKEGPLEPSDIGFRLGPRLNAGGRIAKASLGLELLCATDLERARKWAKILDQCNSDRQEMQTKQVREAISQAEENPDRPGFVVASAHWHPGIVGLVASRITEHFHRPSVAFSIDKETARGSARSISGISIIEILENLKGLLEQFGGHTLAAGLTIKKENIEIFRQRFENILEEKFHSLPIAPTLMIDHELQLGDINDRLLQELQSLQPFGIQNPEPVFLCRQLKWSDAKIVGEKHLKLKVSNGNGGPPLEAIAFNQGNRHPLPFAALDVACVLQWNTYRETRTLQLKISDLKVAAKII